jgi:anti-sigma-K factor RskA
VNVQDYISSGIVESYVLGLASAEEQVEFETMCRQYPEVLQARISFEETMEKQALQNAVAPPPALKQQVMDAALRSEARIIPINTGTKETKTNWLKYAAAACAVLLAGSLFWNISQYNRNKKLQASYNEVVKDYDSAAIRLGEIEDEIAMLRSNPNLKMAAMKGMPISPASFATVYMDSTTKDVYLVVNNLPKPASNKQYQLWALLDGRPIDLGMIDNNYFIDQKKLVLRMKNVSAAQAFAITLEKEGGNPTPQGEMYVLGNL